jgi:hypothetical protein
MIAWKVAVAHLKLDKAGIDFSKKGGRVGLSDETEYKLRPGGELFIDDNALGKADG